MPSASSAKTEKQIMNIAAEITDQHSNIMPIRQAIIIIEHKIRNLEKRKTKLESYRDIQSSGKELSSDQKSAVAKYEEVAKSLEFARELLKQVEHIAISSEKETKRQARKDAALRTQAETIKIREVLTIQNILSSFVDAEIREDFLNGRNGAIKLDEKELQLLENFYMDIQVKRQKTSDDISFMSSAQKAAEYLSMAIDSRPKQYGESTFENLRKLLQSIQECGYFDRASESLQSQTIGQLNEDASQSERKMDSQLEENIINLMQNVSSQEKIATVSSNNHNIDSKLTPFSTEAPSATAVPAPVFLQPQHTALGKLQASSTSQIPRSSVMPTAIVTVSPPQIAQVPTVAAPPTAVNSLHTGHFPGTTVRAVERAYFKQNPYVHPITPIRPLSEVIGPGNFYFLQDSELDSPDMLSCGLKTNETSITTVKGAASGNVSHNQATSTISGNVNLHATVLQPSQVSVSLTQSGHSNKPQPQSSTPIPTQTFTNQSFPPIVSSQTIYPAAVPNPDISVNNTPIPVFANQSIPIPVVASQVQLSAMHNVEHKSSVNVKNQQGPPTKSIITGDAISVPLVGFTDTNYNVNINNTVVGIKSQNNVNMGNEKFDLNQNSNQILSEKIIHKPLDSIKPQHIGETSENWDTIEQNAKPVQNDEDSNQWNSNNAVKNDWSNNFDNQVESNSWNSAVDSYISKNSRNTFNTNRNSGGGGSRTSRGTNSQGNINYRGRPNSTYQPQPQNNRNGSYFRANDTNNFYQNHNGSYNGNKQESSSGNYGSGTNGTYRNRGTSLSSRQQNNGRLGQPGNSGTQNRSNINANRGTRNPGSSYVNSRPTNNVRHHQDVN